MLIINSEHDSSILRSTAWTQFINGNVLLGHFNTKYFQNRVVLKGQPRNGAGLKNSLKWSSFNPISCHFQAYCSECILIVMRTKYNCHRKLNGFYHEQRMFFVFPDCRKRRVRPHRRFSKRALTNFLISTKIEFNQKKMNLYNTLNVNMRQHLSARIT